MLEYLGGALGFWLLYALIASFTKHKVSIIITALIGLLAGVSALIVRADSLTLISTILAVVLINVFAPLQIKSDAKDAWKSRRK